LDVLLKIKNVGATACWKAPVFDIYSDSDEEYSPCATLHLQTGSKKNSEMREPPLVGWPLP
jgi:hypothetical protein